MPHAENEAALQRLRWEMTRTDFDGTVTVERDVLTAALDALDAAGPLIAAAHALACEAHLVVESWHAGHIEGMVELSLAERAYFAAAEHGRGAEDGA